MSSSHESIFKNNHSSKWCLTLFLSFITHNLMQSQRNYRVVFLEFWFYVSWFQVFADISRKQSVCSFVNEHVKQKILHWVKDTSDNYPYRKKINVFLMKIKKWDSGLQRLDAYRFDSWHLIVSQAVGDSNWIPLGRV